MLRRSVRCLVFVCLAILAGCFSAAAQQAPPASQPAPAAQTPPAAGAMSAPPSPHGQTFPQDPTYAQPSGMGCPGQVFKVFQFPANMIPRIDGNADDWAIVPDDYAVGIDKMHDDTGKHPAPDPASLDVKVKVGWVKGENRLYFLYQAYDKYWDFARPDLHNDTFEIVVDGDLSGGPLIAEMHPNRDITPWEAFFSMQSVHAQNYHIFTPAEGKDWTMMWGPQQWLKELPYSNHAYNYNFRPGQPGKLTLEFYITPFDYAAAEGPLRSIPSKLTENKLIGLSWAVIDYNDVNSNGNDGFWNLSNQHKMYGNASFLCEFRLMPLEPQFRKAIDAQWSFTVVDMDRKVVAFKDESVGATSWKWDFGDGTSSTDEFPIHTFPGAGRYTVILDVTGPAGTSRLSKVWGVNLE
jgi:hypothetical protein